MSSCLEFDLNCERCPRLASFLKDIRAERPDYFARPVPSFGDKNPRLLIVGLAPGMHGANRTGRPFTGDYAGVLLYESLHKLGLASKSTSDHADDDLQLHGVRISNAVKCLPPQNKPETSEIRNCNPFIKAEIDALPTSCSLFALGTIAHQAILRAYGLKLSSLKFGHAAVHELPDGRKLFDSYHCSRYNTQTKRLTEKMFMDALTAAMG
ncbi:MAG: uracil-DNA glycosylase [Mariprofundaceae bacterium]